MRVLLQRVSSASVTIAHEVVRRVGCGYLLFVGFGKADNESVLSKAAEKILSLRLFPDSGGRFHYTLEDVHGEVLAVPQFTLYADCSKGRRPDFFGSLEPVAAEKLFLGFVAILSAKHAYLVETGVFGANMQVELVNDGPVTLQLEF
jgi:D-aminoacyl-tRNA deacylase